MNTHQIVKTKESTLSATVKGQKNTSCNNSPNNGSGENKLLENKDNSFAKSHECCGGMCSTSWKPIPNIA